MLTLEDLIKEFPNLQANSLLAAYRTLQKKNVFSSTSDLSNELAKTGAVPISSCYRLAKVLAKGDIFKRGFQNRLELVDVPEKSAQEEPTLRWLSSSITLEQLEQLPVENRDLKNFIEGYLAKEGLPVGTPVLVGFKVA